MTSHDVYITSRQKSRQSTMCIVIKGIEKFITNIYDARHQLLKLSSDRIVGAIPSSYYGPDDMSMFKNSSVSQLLAGPTSYGPISPIQQIPQITWNVPDMNMNSWRSRPAALTSSLLQQHNKMTSNMHVPNRNSLNDLHSSGYHSFTTESMKNASNGGSSVHSSPENGHFNGNKFNGGPMGGGGGSNGFIETSSPQTNRNFNDLSYNFDPRIVAGIRAINTNPSSNEMRIPTPIWQGAGISRTSPVPLESTPVSSTSHQHNNSWIESQPGDGLFPNMTTSLLDTTPTRQRHQISKYKDIATLLTGIGLQHHIQSFIDAEIDMTVFPTLTEQDLQNLGINTFGARRRITMAVKEFTATVNLQKEMMMKQRQQAQVQNNQPNNTSPPTPLRFNGSSAPGDERRSSTGH